MTKIIDIILTGILSHNSTSYTVFALWYAIRNKDKKVLICANKFKTAKDILSRIKMAYEMLPNWMKPGIVTWNASEIEFSNRLQNIRRSYFRIFRKTEDLLTV